MGQGRSFIKNKDLTPNLHSDGITEDLITDLSKISGIMVIARNSTSVYKGKPIKIRQVAEELGVRYVLEGSVRRGGDDIRINAQLIDAEGSRNRGLSFRVNLWIYLLLGFSTRGRFEDCLF